jgi:hypothetical protein
MTAATLPLAAFPAYGQPTNPALLKKDTGLLRRFIPDVDFDDVIRTYYPYFRLLGYMAQFNYPAASRKVDSLLNRHEKLEAWGNKWLPTARRWNKAHAAENMLAAHDKFVSDKRANVVKAFVNLAECVAFLALDVIFFVHEKNRIRESAKFAVAAEMGKDPGKVNLNDIRKSSNLILDSAKDRFYLRSVLRLGGDLAFLHSLPAALIPMAFRITLERGTVDDALGYDILQKRVRDVQIMNLGTGEKPMLVQDLKRVIQKTLKDHGLPSLSEEQIAANQQILDRVADNIIRKRFGMNEAIYVLGRIINHPDSPAQTQDDLFMIGNIGMQDFARLKAGVIKDTASLVKDVMQQGPQKAKDAAQAPLGNALTSR